MKKVTILIFAGILLVAGCGSELTKDIQVEIQANPKANIGGYKMLATTKKAVSCVMENDPTLTPELRRICMAAMKSALNGEPLEPRPPEGLIRRHGVAEMLNVSVRSVDQLAAEGTLQRVKFPGRSRAAGFRRSDVLRLMEVE